MKKTDMVTKKDFYTNIVEMFSTMDGSDEFFSKGKTIITYSDVVDFFTKEIELLEKKSNYKSNKPTKTQEENEVLKNAIMEVLNNNKHFMTIKEIKEGNNLLKDLSSSKMSALLTQLKNDNKIEKTYEKKVVYFKAL